MEPHVQSPELEVRELRAQLLDMRSRLERVEALLTAQHAMPDDPWERWRREHWAELLSYAGQRVAIHPTLGIVAHDKSLNEVVKQVRARGLEKEVLVESVHVR